MRYPPCPPPSIPSPIPAALPAASPTRCSAASASSVRWPSQPPKWSRRTTAATGRRSRSRFQSRWLVREPRQGATRFCPAQGFGTMPGAGRFGGGDPAVGLARWSRSSGTWRGRVVRCGMTSGTAISRIPATGCRRLERLLGPRLRPLGHVDCIPSRSNSAHSRSVGSRE